MHAPRKLFRESADPRQQIERVRTPLLACHRVAFLGTPAAPADASAGLAVALGALLAEHRCHQVAVLDLAPPRPDAAAPTPPHALSALLTAAPLPDAFRHVGGRLALLTARPEHPYADHRQSLTDLGTHYPVVLADATGAGDDARQAAVASAADQVVIRADASLAGARTASALLDRLAAEGRGELARGAVVAFTPAPSGAPGPDRRHLVAHFLTRCRGVVVLPRRRPRARAAAILELAALTGDAMADRRI
ncbi:hypothetical protein AB0C76_03185 [Kitasatospora sp. NPDC048722]|uniref:hypothetical protein n=1 Tax=Kitasatospora sp. NPDC048722 TaxID=3155639 RepID=UPI0033D0E019